jgi:8-hydroxy-5-deazaflavin:NADPH oxidoreductase
LIERRPSGSFGQQHPNDEKERTDAMKVGILGSGVVAQTLGAGFLRHGHAVMLGTRDATKLAAWAAQHDGAAVGSFADAAAFGELLVLSRTG